MEAVGLAVVWLPETPSDQLTLVECEEDTQTVTLRVYKDNLRYSIMLVTLIRHPRLTAKHFITLVMDKITFAINHRHATSNSSHVECGGDCHNFMHSLQWIT